MKLFEIVVIICIWAFFLSNDLVDCRRFIRGSKPAESQREERKRREEKRKDEENKRRFNEYVRGNLAHQNGGNRPRPGGNNQVKERQTIMDAIMKKADAKSFVAENKERENDDWVWILLHVKERRKNAISKVQERDHGPEPEESYSLLCKSISLINESCTSEQLIMNILTMHSGAKYLLAWFIFIESDLCQYDQESAEIAQIFKMTVAHWQLKTQTRGFFAPLCPARYSSPLLQPADPARYSCPLLPHKVTAPNFHTQFLPATPTP